MIDKNVVKQLVNEWLEDKDYFLVDVNVTPDDKITVEIDHADGVWIEDCAKLSQYIEDHLSRDDEDYELKWIGRSRTAFQGGTAIPQLCGRARGSAPS